MSIFKFGEMERGDAAHVLRIPERTARTVVSKLTEQGFLKSSTPKGPVRVAFPWTTASVFFRTCSLKEKSRRPNPRHCSSAGEDGGGLNRSNRREELRRSRLIVLRAANRVAPPGACTQAASHDS